MNRLITKVHKYRRTTVPNRLSDEARKAIAHEYFSTRKSNARIGREYGCSANTVTYWARKYKEKVMESLKEENHGIV